MTHLRLLGSLVLFTFLAAGIDLAGQRVDPCFETVETPPWTGDDLALPFPGASRHPEDSGDSADFELCSRGGGFADPGDGFRFVTQAVRGDFELTARLESISDVGVAGLIASANVRDPLAAHVRIVARRDPTGGFALRSAHRPFGGDPVDMGAALPVVAVPPVHLKITRSAGILTTSYSQDGEIFIEHLLVPTAATELHGQRTFAGMVQASEADAIAASAIFRAAALSTNNPLPPAVDCADTFTAPLDGETEITITGRFGGGHHHLGG